jgi:hypothetical protein
MFAAMAGWVSTSPDSTPKNETAPVRPNLSTRMEQPFLMNNNINLLGETISRPVLAKSLAPSGADYGFDLTQDD